MTDPSASNQWPPHPRSWVGYLIGLQFLFGLPAVLSALTPWQFLPSPAWADEAYTLALCAGLAFAAFMAWAVGRHSFFGTKGAGSSRRVGKIVLASAIWFTFGYLGVLVSVPMVDATMFGHHTARTFVISRDRLTQFRYPMRGTYIEGLPLLANRLYHLPDTFLRQLTPGTKVIISGRGTARGVFVGYVSIAEDGK